MTSRLEQAGLLARTIRQLTPRQVVHRARLRAQRKLVAAVPPGAAARLFSRAIPMGHGWPLGFAPVDARAEGSAERGIEIAQGVFDLVGERRELGLPPAWHAPGATQLWRYHLHYFDWGWDLLRAGARIDARAVFDDLWRSWRESSPVGRGDAWSPYVVSLRAWSLCGLFEPLVQGGRHEEDVVRSLGTHAGFLRWHLERDVGGNHLVKNLKALVGLGVFLGDRRLLELGLEGLGSEVDQQVLPDGGHYERSPSYHAQVLGDLQDIVDLVAAGAAPVPPAIERATEQMRIWLSTMLLPDGDVPLLNDCVLLGGDRIADLRVALPSSRERHELLGATGYAVIARDRLHLVLDVGEPCPPGLPAHAHADTFTFELVVDGRRLIVDGGTSSYQDPERRRIERATSAHNTLEIDGQSSTEVWGAFRAARRARPVVEVCRTEGDTTTVVATHDGYARLDGAPVHRRSVAVTSDGVELLDEVTGSGSHRIAVRLHAAPGVDCQFGDDGTVRLGSTTVRSSWPLTLQPAHVATGFNRRHPTTCVVAEQVTVLPVTVRTRIELDPVA